MWRVFLSGLCLPSDSSSLLSEHLKATPQEGRRSPGKHPASEEGPQGSPGCEALGSRFFWPMEFPCRLTPFTYSFCQFPDTNPMWSTEDTLLLKKISFHEGGELKVGGGQALPMKPDQLLWKFRRGSHPSWGIREGFLQEAAFRWTIENVAVKR